MTMRKCFAEATKKTLSRDCSRIAKDNRRPHTSPVVALVGRKPASDRRADNECRPETPAAESAAMRETKLAVLSWERTDIFLSHDASGEDDC